MANQSKYLKNKETEPEILGRIAELKRLKDEYCHLQGNLDAVEKAIYDRCDIGGRRGFSGGLVVATEEINRLRNKLCELRGE